VAAMTTVVGVPAHETGETAATSTDAAWLLPELARAVEISRKPTPVKTRVS
ncbi:MAG: hypothetical protein IIC51_08315, partial [Planctomycetes bacterium]|nr:hypothetical protein [Planctomycetota bacterium]